MSADQVMPSTSTHESSIQSEDSKVVLWSAWKICENLLKENGYLLEQPSSKVSMFATEMATEMYNRIVDMIDAMEFTEDEELVLPNDENAVEDYERCISDEVEEEEWKEDAGCQQWDLIPLSYKKKVVALAKAHPKWSLAALQKNGASRLKRKSYIKM